MRPLVSLMVVLTAISLVAGCGSSSTPGAQTPAAASVAKTATVAAPKVAATNRTVAKRPAVTAALHAISRGAPIRSALSDEVQPACGRPGAAPATYQHIVWIWLENRSYGTVIGEPGSRARRRAPYFNRLADSCGLATNYHNVSHPSQPNYFAAVAGTTGNVTTNCEPSTCSLGDLPTLFTQLSSTGRQWRSYEESMPTPCASGNVGDYVDRHNPEVYFSSDAEQCRTWDVPLGTLSSGPLDEALADNTLPAFSFVTPNVCSDMHSCSTRDGDVWLERWVPKITDSPGYEQGDTALFITFDEGEGGHTYNCAENTTDVGCHVATIVVSPSTPRGTRSDELFNHYSLLKTTEQLLGLRQLLGHAADADTNSMVAAFGL
jgi:phosphatidylinositol-3-phosphatase